MRYKVAQPSGVWEETSRVVADFRRHCESYALLLCHWHQISGEKGPLLMLMMLAPGLRCLWKLQAPGPVEGSLDIGTFLVG